MSFFGKNIKKIRSVKKLSQQAFADIFSLKRGTLGAYEEERSEPKIDTIIKIANYFSISIDNLLTKNITVNQLLRFNEGITTDINQIVKASFTDIPFVNSLNSHQFITDFKTTENYDSLPVLSMPITATAALLAFTVANLYMVSNEEGLFPGDVVVGESTVPENLTKDDVVIVLANDALSIRRYNATDTGYHLSADHIHIAPIIIPYGITIHFWKVSYVFLKRYPKFTSKLDIQLDKLDTVLKQLNKV
ncbi:helix-turn-helix transcriptional regulator [Tenacibaculum finnmarkense]|uniref:helix-turn-helix domain-containing protein n=1 Tax=Tenacibaculum finnmarkense TaxID=2781243 RepID=UPI00187B91DA|nr:helix-turn-helix transcriptional regulator [Tenacibaculum finnmarkense]MBE7644505.1 helix-turn-helix domain-containing protein [Tenacibaculum finnmarkense genomovar ulcerans]MBE7648094.1 helix-turn-helix domain-containing protein [Tenacibaculum finnmarkense genomovar ulcerans]MCD8422150.1 helix-turn-helix domain-containing protein [Tenacibaculum finnmarkense genomovar ulcerans]MCD8431191.1 helix-turn-helix domain-containing protein [Tenacibaculum finnmarkense genomovar ulcerans]MCD8445327.1